MHSQLKVIKSELNKGKSSNKVSHAADELQLMDFNSSITQSMAKTSEHLTDFVFVTVANTALARRDSYLSHLKMGINRTLWLPYVQDHLFPHCSLMPPLSKLSKTLQTLRVRDKSSQERRVVSTPLNAQTSVQITGNPTDLP